MGSLGLWAVCMTGSLVVSVYQVETECRQSELSVAEQEQALRLKSRAVELLPDGAANLTKLQVGWDWFGSRVVGWMDPACFDAITRLLPARGGE